MAELKPFSCIRPQENLVEKIAALPYDVVNRREAKEIVKANPYSFLKIDRAETQLEDCIDIYSDTVYEKARDTLQEMIEDGSFLTEESSCYYIYELTMHGRTQTGIVGCASVDDYLNDRIKKHENTKPEKELDRIRHVDTCSAHTGPIFLAYRKNNRLSQIQEEEKRKEPLYAFVAEDGIRHRVWKVDEENQIGEIYAIFESIPEIYIADGHHRAASAVKTGLKRRKEAGQYTGAEEFNYFLSVLFPDQELMIMDYNRFVHDLNGRSTEEFLKLLEEFFSVEKIGTAAYKPEKKGEIGMYIEHKWYCLTLRTSDDAKDPSERLDVAQLQKKVLTPILGIEDPKTDSRIEFVGGIRGLSELEKLVDQREGSVAFAMYPTSMEELFEVADAGLLMPPKSTWFEPKLRSGLFIHKF